MDVSTHVKIRLWFDEIVGFVGFVGGQCVARACRMARQIGSHSARLGQRCSIHAVSSRRDQPTEPPKRIGAGVSPAAVKRSHVEAPTAQYRAADSRRSNAGRNRLCFARGVGAVGVVVVLLVGVVGFVACVMGILGSGITFRGGVSRGRKSRLLHASTADDYRSCVTLPGKNLSITKCENTQIG